MFSRLTFVLDLLLEICVCWCSVDRSHMLSVPTWALALIMISCVTWRKSQGLSHLTGAVIPQHRPGSGHNSCSAVFPLPCSKSQHQSLIATPCMDNAGSVCAQTCTALPSAQGRMFTSGSLVPSSTETLGLCCTENVYNLLKLFI